MESNAYVWTVVRVGKGARILRGIQTVIMEDVRQTIRRLKKVKDEIKTIFSR